MPGKVPCMFSRRRGRGGRRRRRGGRPRPGCEAVARFAGKGRLGQEPRVEHVGTSQLSGHAGARELFPEEGQVEPRVVREYGGAARQSQEGGSQVRETRGPDQVFVRDAMDGLDDLGHPLVRIHEGREGGEALRAAVLPADAEADGSYLDDSFAARIESRGLEIEGEIAPRFPVLGERACPKSEVSAPDFARDGSLRPAADGAHAPMTFLMSAATASALAAEAFRAMARPSAPGRTSVRRRM